jgi:hypothetical protein
MKHPYRWLIATFLLALAVQPVLLPHPLWVQVVIGGAAGAQGYGLAALGGFLTRRLTSRLTSWRALPAPPPAMRQRRERRRSLAGPTSSSRSRPCSPAPR